MTAGQGQSTSNVHLVIYDGACGVCQAFALWLMRSDRRERLSLIAYQQADLEQLAPDLSRKALQQAMHFIGVRQRPFRGARAVFEALKQLPGTWGVIGFLLANPLASALAEPFYRLLAKHRTTLSRFLKLQVCEPAPALLRENPPKGDA